MKKIIFSALLSAALLTGPIVAFAAAPPAPAVVPKKPVTGRDWLLMSAKEKSEYMASAIQFLKGQGIPFRKPIAYYVEVANQVVDMPGNDKAPVITILSTTAYKDDPAARGVIDKIQAEKKKLSRAS
jgi:hypothetical protein